MSKQHFIPILTSISKGWLHQEGGFTFEKRYYLDPLYRRDQDIAIDQFREARFPGYLIKNLESNLVQSDQYDPRQIMVGGIQPNLILGMCLGSDMSWYLDKDIDLASTNLLAEITLIDQLLTPNQILNHPVIHQFDQQIIDLQGDHPSNIIIPPFFWDTSGRATIHGIITTSMKFLGDGVFLNLYKTPEFIKDFHRWIADVYIALIQHYAELGNLPVTSVHIGECTGAMLGAAHFEEFVLPYINRIAEALGPVRLHSCGKSDHLLPVMKKLTNLQVLDTGSNTSVATIRQEFGNDFQIDIAPPVEVLLKDVPRAEALFWLDQTLAENEDGPLLIGFHIEPGYSIKNCLAIHDALK